MTLKDKENIEILVKSIIEKDESMIHVKDSALIPYYVHNSKHMIEIEPKDMAALQFFTFRGSKIKDDFQGIKNRHFDWAKDRSANYIFSSTYYENNGTLVSVATPFRIISDKETDFLAKNFYKDIPEKVSKAAKELKIVLYDKIYPFYMQGKIDRFGEVLHANRKSWDNYSPFLNFVFNLPYEEQNIEANKKIIRSFSFGCDFLGIMTKEYSEGRHFQEYFENLHHYEGKKIVEFIKGLERKPDHDVYLLKKGFVVGEDSALGLYRQDSHAFINYFKKLGNESRKIIIEKIYEDSFVNQEIVEWLEKSYSDLLREVGFSGGKQNGSNS